MENLLIEIGEGIKNLRLEKGISQEQLASISGIDRAQLSKIENGILNGVTYLTLSKIYSSFNLELLPSKPEKEFKIHPFVKWAGGKTQLLNTIYKHLPVNFNRYFEPFVGGGALLFSLQPKSFSINDVNEELIDVYKCLQDEKLYILFVQTLDKYTSEHSEDFYLKIRAMDREDNFSDLPIYIRAARMVYLNKSCFNGLYRVNSKGFFNVPSGKKEKVVCYDKENLDGIFNFFKSTSSIITNVSYKEAVRNAHKGDFVYFDPPYDTWEDKDSFTSYGKDDFGKKEQAELAALYKELSDKGVYVMLSNHNTKYINELYKDFHINVVPAKRMINSKADQRGNVEEVIITNYE